MPSCMYCGRDELPRLPMMPHRVDVVTAHAKTSGEPCNQGGNGDLPEDYPRDELVTDDGWWDLSGPIAPSTPETGIELPKKKPRNRKKRHLAMVT